MVKKILKAKLLSAIFAASLGFVVGGSIWAYAMLRGVPGPIILHFNNISGISSIGSVFDLFLISITAAAMVIVNFFLALELEARDWFLGKIVAAATLVLSVLIFIAFAAIISVN